MAHNLKIRHSSGFTLTELMAVVAIVAVLAAIAAPNMRAFMDSQMVKNPASDLYASLVLARSEAIKRNAAIDVEPVATDWAQGWKVKVQSTGVELRDQQAYARVSVAASQAGKLTYGSNGRLSTSATLFRVTAPGNAEARMRCVSVDVSGRPNVRIDRNSDQTVCD